MSAKEVSASCSSASSPLAASAKPPGHTSLSEAITMRRIVGESSTTRVFCMAESSIVHRGGPRRTPGCPKMHELGGLPAHPRVVVERPQYNAGTTVFTPYKKDTLTLASKRDERHR